jgi:hypothetical protein
MNDNDRNQVRVLTAGGAAATATPPSSSRKNKKKQHKKKHPPVEQAPVADDSEQAVSAGAAVTSTTSADNADDAKPEAQNDWDRPEVPVRALEIEHEDDWDSPQEDEHTDDLHHDTPYADDPKLAASMDPHNNTNSMYPSSVPVESSTTHHTDTTDTSSNYSDVVWLTICFLGIMASFVCYGLLLEYTTSGGRNLHELSFLFVTSGLYTLTAAAGRYVRDETPSTIPPARFALLGLTSMGSTFCSVRSLRYVCLLY